MPPAVRRICIPRRTFNGVCGASFLDCSRTDKTLAFDIDHDVPPRVSVPTGTARTVENDLAFHCRESFVETLAGVRLKRTFVVQVAPGMQGTNLVRAPRNADDAAPMEKPQRKIRLLAQGLIERESSLQPDRKSV